jgi:hypothetical protein
VNDYDAETLAGLATLNARGISLPIELSQASPEVMRFNVLQRVKALPPRVQILHTRDPDSECEFEVWLDGVKTDSYGVDDLDPGRGWTREDWDQRVEEAREDTSEFGQRVLAELLSVGEHSKWIED